MSIKSKITQTAIDELDKIVKTKQTFADIILTIRLCEEMSQTKFAHLLGISKSYLCDIEHGRKTVSPKLAAEYAKKLGYDGQQFVRLALQDIVDRAGLDYDIEIGLKSKLNASRYNNHLKHAPKHF